MLQQESQQKAQLSLSLRPKCCTAELAVPWPTSSWERLQETWQSMGPMATIRKWTWHRNPAREKQRNKEEEANVKKQSWQTRPRSADKPQKQRHKQKKIKNMKKVIHCYYLFYEDGGVLQACNNHHMYAMGNVNNQKANVWWAFSNSLERPRIVNKNQHKSMARPREETSQHLLTQFKEATSQQNKSMIMQCNPHLASWGSQAEVLTAGVMRFRCAVYRIYVQLSNAYVIIIMFLLSNPFGWNQW